MSFQSKMKEGVLSGVKKGWFGFTWMLKILIPISFLTMLLNYSGWLHRIDFIMEPAMSFISLPAIAALPLVVGMLTGIYGGIAAMVMLPLSSDHMTLIGIFLLISHNLIQEGIIQGQSGMNAVKITLIRLTASILTVVAVAQFIKPASAVSVVNNSSIAETLSFLTVINHWGLQTLYLSIKIFIIIMSLMIFLGILKHFNLIPYIVKALRPVLKAIGLDERVGILWLTAVVFGIAYGAAVILEEAKEGNLTSEELAKLHISIGINHSMVEDPSLFVSLGLNPFWLWIPRLITAIAAVHLFNLCRVWLYPSQSSRLKSLRVISR